MEYASIRGTQKATPSYLNLTAMLSQSVIVARVYSVVQRWSACGKDAHDVGSQSEYPVGLGARRLPDRQGEAKSTAEHHAHCR